MQSVEYKLVTKALTTSDDKYFIAAYNMYFNLIWLNGEVGTGAGDVAGGADYGPTDTARELLGTIEKDLAAAKAGVHDADGSRCGWVQSDVGCGWTRAVVGSGAGDDWGRE